jgi:transcriptional regulator of arginine metabolism
MAPTKDERLATISRVLRAEPVRTQDQLLKILRGRGMRVDQSTLSRDLVEIGVRKSSGRYVVPPEPATPTPSEPRFDVAVQSFTVCGPHLVVIKTALGAAQPLAVKIDQVSEPAIVATLAGDDTIFVATKNRRSQVVALRRLQQWFGDKQE